MYRTYNNRSIGCFFLLFFFCVLCKPLTAEALEMQALDMILPQASTDVFVSDNIKDWTIVTNENRYKLITPIVRNHFSERDAEEIDEVVLIFSPAGAVISQTSKIFQRDGIWHLEVNGVLSRKNVQGLTIHSIELIYVDYSAELLKLKEAVSVGALNAQNENSGGCDGKFGFTASLLCLLFFLRRRNA